MPLPVVASKQAFPSSCRLIIKDKKLDALSSRSRRWRSFALSSSTREEEEEAVLLVQQNGRVAVLACRECTECAIKLGRGSRIYKSERQTKGLLVASRRWNKKE